MNLNWRKMLPDKRESLLREGLLHLEFAMLLADLQRSEGRLFAHEHPDLALSWNNNKIAYLQQDPAVRIARFDMCCYGMRTMVNMAPVRKTTKVLTNLQALHTVLHNCLCHEKHTHTPIQGSEGGVRRSTWAQRYPEQFCKTVAETVAHHLRGTPQA